MASVIQNLWGRFTNAVVPYSGSTNVVGGRFTAYLGSLFGEYDCESAVVDGIWRNAVVSIGLDWMSRNWHQARLVVVEVDGDGVERSVGKHPLLRLLRRPHPGLSRNVLVSGFLRDVWSDGSFFAEKVKNRLGEVVELRPWGSHKVDPLYPMDGSDYLLGWGYEVNGERKNVPLDRVLHIRRWSDPKEDRRGWSPLKSLGRELSVLNEASTYTAALLKNYAVPGLILTPNGDWTTSDDDARSVKDKIKAALTGELRGEAMVLTGAYDVQKAGFTPEEVGLTKIPVIAASQVLGAMGLNLTALGLDMGGNNKEATSFSEAVRSCWVHGLMPVQQVFADDLTDQLLVDFEDPERVLNGEIKVTWDWSGVAELEDREQVIANKAIRLYQAGTHTLNETREMTGYGPSTSPDADLVGLDRAKVQMAAGVGQTGPLGPDPAGVSGTSEGDSLGGVRTDRKPSKGGTSKRTGDGGKGSGGGGVPASGQERRRGDGERSGGVRGRTRGGDGLSPSRMKSLDETDNQLDEETVTDGDSE